MVLLIVVLREAARRGQCQTRRNPHTREFERHIHVVPGSAEGGSRFIPVAAGPLRMTTRSSADRINPAHGRAAVIRFQH